MFVLHHPDTINMQADNGMTALIGATLHGQRKILELLLNKGADIDGTDERGITALMHACRAGDKEIAEYLISRGASVNIIGKKVIDEVTRVGNCLYMILRCIGADCIPPFQWSVAGNRHACRRVSGPFLKDDHRIFIVIYKLFTFYMNI